MLGGLVGDADAPTYATRARELAAAVGDERLVRRANILVAGMLFDSGDIDQRRAVLEEEYREWQERDELFCAGVLWDLSWIQLWDGRWGLAAEHAARARDIRVQYGVERNQDYIPSSWVAAHLGQLDLALEESERALKLCDEQIGFHPPLLAAVPGLVALWRGDAATAAERLGAADRQAAALGWSAPDARPWTADYVEALLELGRIDDAEQVIDLWEADAVRLGRNRVLAHVTRCRGLVAAARGAVDEATRSWSRRSHGTTRSATSLDGLARCSHSESSSGAHGRSVLPKTRSTLRSAASSNLEQPPGSRGRVPSWGGSAGAHGRKG